MASSPRRWSSNPLNSDPLRFDEISQPWHTGTISPRQILKTHASLSTHAFDPDSIYTTSDHQFGTTLQRRTPINDIRDMDLFGNHRNPVRRNSCQIGTCSTPSTSRVQFSTANQPDFSPLMHQNPAMMMMASKDHKLSPFEQDPRSPFLHDQQQFFTHAQSLPASPLPLPLKWPPSTNASYNSTLAPENPFHRRSSTDCSSALGRSTPPSTPFESEPDAHSSHLSAFPGISPSSYIPSLSLAHSSFDHRPIGFFKDPASKQIPNDTPKHSLDFSLQARAFSQPLDGYTPGRPSSANATCASVGKVDLPIDPSLLYNRLRPDETHMTANHTAPDDQLFPDLLRDSLSNAPLNPGQSICDPTPTFSALGLSQVSNFRINDSISHDMDGSLTPLSIDQVLLKHVSASSSGQRASSLPPPALPDSSRYLQHRCSGTSGPRQQPGPPGSEPIGRDTGSLFDDEFLRGYSNESSPHMNLADVDIPVTIESDRGYEDRPSFGFFGQLRPQQSLSNDCTPIHQPSGKDSARNTRVAQNDSWDADNAHRHDEPRSASDRNTPVSPPCTFTNREPDSQHDIDRIPPFSARSKLADSPPGSHLKGGGLFHCTSEGCPKSFGRKSDLARHMRIHTGERPFACEYAGCGKRFIQRSALTVHSRTHSGEKPHLCIHAGCAKTFADSSSLARHRRTHTKSKVYACSVRGCGKNFTRRAALMKHVKMHEFESGGGIGNVEIVAPSPATDDRPGVSRPAELKKENEGGSLARLPVHGTYIKSPLSRAVPIYEETDKVQLLRSQLGPLHVRPTIYRITPIARQPSRPATKLADCATHLSSPNSSPASNSSGLPTPCSATSAMRFHLPRLTTLSPSVHDPALGFYEQVSSEPSGQDWPPAGNTDLVRPRDRNTAEDDSDRGVRGSRTDDPKSTAAEPARAAVTGQECVSGSPEGAQRWTLGALDLNCLEASAQR